jgi:hypothetical protein
MRVLSNLGYAITGRSACASVREQSDHPALVFVVLSHSGGRAVVCGAHVSRGLIVPGAWFRCLRRVTRWPGLAGADASRLFGGDVGAGSGVAVTGPDQDPAALAGAGQGKAPGELAAVQEGGQVAGLVAGDFGGALRPR